MNAAANGAPGSSAPVKAPTAAWNSSKSCVSDSATKNMVPMPQRRPGRSKMLPRVTSAVAASRPRGSVRREYSGRSSSTPQNLSQEWS